MLTIRTPRSVRSLLVMAALCAGSTGLLRADDDRKADAPAKARVASIEISGALAERPPELSYLFGAGETSTLSGVIETLRDAAHDDAIRGVMIRLKDAELTATQVQELAEAMKVVQAAGKKIHVFSDAYATPELLLASHCDEAIAQDGGPVMFSGMYMEEMFLADTLKWAGLQPDFVQVGDYKGASEAMARNAPSKEWDQNINQLLDSLYANMRAPIKAARKLDDAGLDKAMSQTWLADANDAKAAGLLDSVIDLPTLSAHLESAYGSKIAWRELDSSAGGDDALADMSNPFALLMKLKQKPDMSPEGDALAIVHIEGPIVDGESAGAGPLGGSSSVGSRTIRNALEDIRKDDNFKGAILRINSPGGSATASEIIWQGVRRLAEKKPVWVSVGSMAASGGYYIAVAGDKIYANPSSIVGSIGVVGGKITLTELYKKFHVNVVGRARGPRAEMFASNVGWDDAMKAEVRRKMTDTYNTFTKRVTMGRPGIDLATTAEGRLFTGDKAIGMKMADKIGGLQTTIDDLADSLHISDFEVMHFPAPRTLEEIAKDTLGGMVSSPRVSASDFTSTLVGPAMIGAVREIVGPKAWAQIEPSLTGILQLRDEPVVLISPSVLIFR